MLYSIPASREVSGPANRRGASVMVELTAETLHQMVAVALVALFVAAVMLADRGYKQSFTTLRALDLPAQRRERDVPILQALAAKSHGNVRPMLIGGVLLLAMLAVYARPAAGEPISGEPVQAPRVAIVDIGMVGPVMRITVVTGGLSDSQGDSATITVSAVLDGVPLRATLPLIRMPSRFAMDLDLHAGVVRVGGVSVGDFAPMPRLHENLRFPVDVTVQRGESSATARTVMEIPLPVVIVPGYLNEWGGASRDVLTAFRRHGFTTSEAGRNVFWFTYPSQQVTLPDAAAALAAYVRRVVLPATYAARVNIVGYSLGGLMARWNVAYDVDGWAALVDRLVLVGVPNEGTVMAYVAAHTPSALPFASLGRRPATPALLPTFPFWRGDVSQPWSLPADGANELLAGLNARPIPSSVHVYIFYGSHDPRRSAGPQTSAGVTGQLPAAALSYGDGDGIVLADSAQGLPIRGGAGVPALEGHEVVRVDLGAVYHTGLLEAGANQIAGALLDRFVERMDAPAAPGD
jgi:Lipase (class 2)